MPMKNPSRPGETVLVLCFEPFDLSIAAAAAHLKVDEEYLSALCNGRERITADLAVHLQQAFDGTAEAWLRLQTTHDLELARNATCDIKRIERVAWQYRPHTLLLSRHSMPS
ncbi:MAG: HigA family addiction module antitoxin [Chloroflexi bacterium]|nr:HigA family addiction module antitoxin [Chloroflexota bacterium]